MEEPRVKKILKILSETYPDAKPGLVFENPYQLLIATILSAQCTDVRVNKVTPALFRDYPDANSLSKCEQEKLEGYIQTCGMYHSKAKNIIETCKIISREYGGEVPADRDALQALPGVGRKTANVVLSNAFGVPALAVDTHVFRVSNRIGLAHAKNVELTEQQLLEVIPEEYWSIAHHWLIWHGRKICSARKPNCDGCPLKEECEFITNKN